MVQVVKAPARQSRLVSDTDPVGDDFVNRRCRRAAGNEITAIVAVARVSVDSRARFYGTDRVGWHYASPARPLGETFMETSRRET